MDRMQVIYRIRAGSGEIDSRARSLAIEQSVEMPPDAIRNRGVTQEIVGRVDAIVQDDAEHFRVTIGLAAETTGFEAGQLMNMLYGNSSLQPDVELLDMELPPAAAGRFAGPRFGIAGLRRMVAAGQRALTCSALKPQGSSVEELANLARNFTLGGIDIIKDDHGLADQHHAPFVARVEAIQRAVACANHTTGGNTIYAPSMTGGPRQILRQLEVARDNGVRALLIAPMVSGLGALQELAADSEMALLAHPALAGNSRIAPPLLLGKLFRLAGADAVIYPNFGGRFSFSATRCLQIAETARQPWHGFAPAMPVPAGGMHPDRVSEMLKFYGDDVMLLIGGALLQSTDLATATREFVKRVTCGRMQ